MEFRVARGVTDDRIENTLELSRAPSFAFMEFLDPNDSQLFANTLSGRGWRNVTPSKHRSRKTLKFSAPADGELDAFKEIGPDWLYLSGHYGRSYYFSNAGETKLTVLPGGFFNEPFHTAEWESAWSHSDPRGVFVQGERLDDDGANVFCDYIAPQPLTHRTADFHSRDERPAVERVHEWCDVWQRPTDVLSVSSITVPASRGLFFSTTWPEVRVLLLVCCNALAWSKQLFHTAFPNAICLGWLGKNPANASPIIRQFLVNAFRGVTDPADVRLMDADHIAAAWTAVRYTQRMQGSQALGYMLPDGRVFGVAADPEKAVEVGHADEIIVHPHRRTHAFGVRSVGGSLELEP